VTGGTDDLERLEIELLLEAIYRHYGFDFRDYTFASIQRRIKYRMQIEHLPNVSALQAQVLHNPKMMKKLLDDFSIHVTEMFRDPEFFLAFRQKVVPILRKLPHIRIWHAGCSTGEEVYSMAILLYEEGLYERTKLYATDMNESLINIAEQAMFPLQKMRLYTRNYLHAGGSRAFSEYYTIKDDYAAFHSFLTKNVTFAQHNLTVDQSFNEFHVIICRNVLIYFNRTLANRVHNLFYESLAPSGFLGLGSKEQLMSTNKHIYYEEIDTCGRIYQKIK